MEANLEDELRAAGWFPGRRVDISAWKDVINGDGYALHPAALAFWAEYGGLAVTCCRPGVTSAREPFNLDPTLALGGAGRFISWSRHLQKFLVPIGEHSEGRFILGIDEFTGVYLVSDWIGYLGKEEEGLESLFLGYACKETEIIE